MADFKLVVADPKTGKAYNVDLGGDKAASIIGKPIGGEVDGTPLGMAGYKLRITGGSDRDGVPMRSDIPEGVRRKVLLSGGSGFISTEQGLRRRKTVRGRVVTTDIVQVNAVVTQPGKQPLGALFGGAAAPGEEKKEPAGKKPAEKKGASEKKAPAEKK